MCFVYGLITLALLASHVCAHGVLTLNRRAALVNEVKSVHHNAASRQVTIALAENRNCTHPMFMVRLSGKSLYLLDLVQNNSSKPELVVFQYPHMPDAGVYFLEVLTIYCKTLNPNAFKHICIVSPQEGKNVLTLPYSFEIKAEESVSSPRPRWVLRDNETAALLPTRYQKKCNKTCSASPASEIAQHNLYEWTDKPEYLHLVTQTLAWGKSIIPHPTGNESITLCMVGASHAAMIVRHGMNLTISDVNFLLVPNRYPQLFDVSLLTNCTYAVIAYGQWPLSGWTDGHPYMAERYENYLRVVLSTIKAANLSTQVFMRSVNLNGLGVRHTSCPTVEFRQPPIMMMYNSLISRLCAEYDIPYIDTFPLQAPLWDIALDWSHPIGRVAEAQAEFIVHSVLSYSHKHRRAPVLDPDFSARAPLSYYPVRIRFNESQTIYVQIGDKYRALSNFVSMRHLGFSDYIDRLHPVKVINASLKSSFTFGPTLPEI